MSRLRLFDVPRRSGPFGRLFCHQNPAREEGSPTSPPLRPGVRRPGGPTPGGQACLMSCGPLTRLVVCEDDLFFEYNLFSHVAFVECLACELIRLPCLLGPTRLLRRYFLPSVSQRSSPVSSTVAVGGSRPPRGSSSPSPPQILHFGRRLQPRSYFEARRSECDERGGFTLRGTHLKHSCLFADGIRKPDGWWWLLSRAPI